MCNLIKKYVDSKTFTGYKIVCVDKNGDYFSPAMGCKYPKRGMVPIVFIQKRLNKSFNEHILERDLFGYRKKMIGRTAVFEIKSAALFEAQEYSQKIIPNYEIKIVKMTISKDLLIGTYGYDKVIAGKYICSIEEI